MHEREFDIKFADNINQKEIPQYFYQLIKNNVEGNKIKQKFFKKIDSDIAIIFEDKNYSLTLRFQKGNLTIFEGFRGIPDITMRGNYDDIIKLTSIDMIMPGIPKIYNLSFIDLIQTIMKKKIRIYGWITKAITLFYFIQILNKN